jgi:cytochrome bd-type quinol oxidase subunit 2
MSDGPARLLRGVYTLFAIAAGARSAYQLATKFPEAPLAYLLSALAAALYVVAALALRADRRQLLAVVASIELAGVLAVGLLTVADPGAFPDETVWSHFGQGYGFLPLVLPVAALAWLRRNRLDSRATSDGAWKPVGVRRGRATVTGSEPDPEARTSGHR